MSWLFAWRSARAGATCWPALPANRSATGAGLALGLALAFAFSGLLSSQLYGVAADDPSVYLTVLLALGSAAALATYLPARQASEVDPVVALRAE